MFPEIMKNPLNQVSYLLTVLRVELSYVVDSKIDLDVSNLEYRIFVLIFSSGPVWRKTTTNIQNSTRRNQWATKDIMYVHFQAS